jgi:TRAP-type C4-dicarboxylate transport system permease small subunit
MQKCFGFFNNAILYSSVASISIMMLLVTSDSAGRYLFNAPIQGAVEITEQYLMIVCTYLGLHYAYSKGAFVRVTFVVDHLAKWMKVILGYLSLGLSILICILLIVAAIKQFLRIFVAGANIGFGNLPLWPPYLIIVVGLIFLCIEMSVDLFLLTQRKPDLFRRESDTTY